MINYKNSKLIRQLSDETSLPVSTLESMWVDSEKEAIKQIMWDPAKYSRYTKENGTLYAYIETILRNSITEG